MMKFKTEAVEVGKKKGIKLGDLHAKNEYVLVNRFIWSGGRKCWG